MKKKFRSCAVIYFIKKLTTIQYVLWLEGSCIYILYACKSYYGDKCDELFFKWDGQIQWKRRRCIDGILMLDVISGLIKPCINCFMYIEQIEMQIITNTMQLYPQNIVCRCFILGRQTWTKQPFLNKCLIL